MGHGASTNVKKITISHGDNGARRKPQTWQTDTTTAGTASTDESGAPSPAKLGWTRSSSDGCIVENLNTSKTKTDLLEQQVDEYKELFHHAEQRADDAQARARLLEQQMAEVEGTNFELLDRVSELEQQLDASKDQSSPEAEREFTQTLLERDQMIEKQEHQIKSLEEDLARMRIKLKKKLRSAQTELAEAKQEAGLKMYSLKDQIASLQAENSKLMERLDRAHSISSAQSQQRSTAMATPNSHISKEEEDAEEWEDGRTKVILELSSQLSTQEQRIHELEETVKEKDREIGALQLQQRANPRPPSGPQRKQSGTNPRTRSAEKRTEPSQVDSSKGWTAEDDGDMPRSSARRQRSASSSSSKGRDGRRSSSAGRQESPSTRHRHVIDDPADNKDSMTNHEMRTVGSLNGTSSCKVRQLSANSVDSAISDHSDSSSAKVSSASSSRQRRRLRNQLSRQSSADGREPGNGISKTHADIRVEGRDSGIGVAADGKSKSSDDLEQLMEDLIGNS